jgi:hypothetical protein
MLARLSGGFNLTQDEYDQAADVLPPELIARALLKRFAWTGDARTLQEAAQLYLRAGDYYHAYEVCTRMPRSYALKQLALKILPRIRRDYPDTPVLGRLVEDTLLVIDLRSGKAERFPGLLPARECEEEELD